IFQHYKALAAASPKPIILYNVPGRTGRNITAATTLRLADIPNIVGIKEASSDMQQCIEILKDRPHHFMVVSGDDALAMAQIACGMDGVISVAANVFPQQFSQMVKHSLQFDFDAAKKLNDQLLKGYDLMFAENNPAGAKAFLSELGILQNMVRLPVVPLSDALHQQLKDYLNTMN
ncbi:MAG: dihydrodipicolinate synthase family protein, partial [Ferruginibacter sp.]